MDNLRIRSKCRNMADLHRKELRLGLKEFPAILNIPQKPDLFSDLIRLTHPFG